MLLVGEEPSSVCKQEPDGMAGMSARRSQRWILSLLGEQGKAGRAAGILQGKRDFFGCGKVPLPASSTSGIS